MADKYKKWSCYLCGDIVIEGQRFGYIPEKGFIHIECLREYISNKFGGSIPIDVEAALDLEEIAAYGIIRVKELERIVGGELREKIESGRHKLEGISALAGSILKDLLAKYEIEI